MRTLFSMQAWGIRRWCLRTGVSLPAVPAYVHGQKRTSDLDKCREGVGRGRAALRAAAEVWSRAYSRAWLGEVSMVSVWLGLAAEGGPDDGCRSCRAGAACPGRAADLRAAAAALPLAGGRHAGGTGRAGRVPRQLHRQARTRAAGAAGGRPAPPRRRA